VLPPGCLGRLHEKEIIRSASDVDRSLTQRLPSEIQLHIAIDRFMWGHMELYTILVILWWVLGNSPHYPNEIFEEWFDTSFLETGVGTYLKQQYRVQ
jgi:hypothetical protein